MADRFWRAATFKEEIPLKTGLAFHYVEASDDFWVIEARKLTAIPGQDITPRDKFRQSSFHNSWDVH